MNYNTIQKIIRKRNYGFEKLINEYSTEIQKASYTNAEVRSMAKQTWDLLQLGNLGQTEALDDIFIELNKRLEKVIAKMPGLLQKMFKHGGSKVMNAKGELLKFAQPKYTAQIQALYTTNLQYLNKYTKDQRRILLKTLEEQFKKGKSFTETAEVVTQRLSGFTKRRAYLIASTEATRASTTAMQTVMQEAGARKYQWITANDARVCPICKKNAQRVYEFGRGPLPVKDTHPLCRCVIVYYS